MEEIVVGVLMLLSFILGAVIREPIRFRKNIHAPKESESNNLLAKIEDIPEEDKEYLKQMVALWNYTEQEGLKRGEDED